MTSTCASPDFAAASSATPFSSHATTSSTAAEHQRAVLDLVKGLPWADVDGAICDMESALRLALEAFVTWEEAAENQGFEDEFSLTPSQVRDLSPEWRLAYVARLLRTLALSY